MSVFFRRSCGAALAYAVVTHGAFADVTANDVWADWQAYLGGLGYTVTGDESVSGNVTTVTNMTMAMALPDSDEQVNIVMPEMTLTENGDGTVNIGFPESYPVTISGSTEGEPFSAELLFTNTDLNMVVSGTPQEMTYDYTASGMGLTLNSVEVDGETMSKDVLDLGFQINDLAGSSVMKIGEQRDIKQKFNAASLDYNLAFDDPESDDDARFKGKLDQLAFEGDSVLPAEFDLENIQDIYENGFAVSGAFTYGAGNTEMAGTAEGEAFSLGSSSQGGSFAGSIDAQRIVYNLQQNSTKLAVTTADLPFPIEIAMENAGLKLEAPMSASDEVQPFAFAMNLTDFTMSDVLWSIFDPAGALPRDPATISLDTNGTAKVLVDFMDPEAIEALEVEDIAPGELHSLKINELIISLVGAKLTGDGDFTFDNSNPEPFAPPVPAGVANLQLVGANALIDKLIGMGLVSDNDALGARMMMGLMAVPGEEPDTLNSKIEFTEDGQILANGQRIK
ncbi:DUF2125 domain-containing protein [Ruegeria sp.]|uniref:DUF2125 domain-containing protein n=1 Tax=Ruegeria sp. TaxID=1879320 RepID=UPI00231613F2|nr:DUF2125 domain-containing protein [Ruegeria sp.]MDA7966767.1 DUF2125 domain-containing protein [Ruegeria sp.]